jgi:hypothetical protein
MWFIKEMVNWGREREGTTEDKEDKLVLHHSYPR